MYIHIYTFITAHTSVRTYFHTYLHTHTHTHTHKTTADSGPLGHAVLHLHAPEDWRVHIHRYELCD